MNDKNRFVLAFSTSSGVAQVSAMRLATSEDSNPLVLFDQGLVEIFGFEIVDYKQQSAELLPMLQQAMARAQIGPLQCAAIAVDIGPGGFTSLRTACGVAQGLGVAWGVPCVALTSFETMGACLGLNNPDSAIVCCLLDARLNEMYGGVLQLSALSTQWLQMPSLAPFSLESALAMAASASQLLCDSGVSSLFEHASGSTAPLPRLIAPNARGLAALAWHRLLHGQTVSPEQCQPLYVREKVAQTTLERMAAKHA